MPSRMTHTTGRGLVLAVIALAMLAATGLAVSAFHPSMAIDVQTAAVTVGSIDHQIVADGAIQAAITTDVGVQISGVVQALDADVDTVIHKGDIIARLDPAPYDAAIADARAQLDRARVSVQQRQAADEAAQLTLARAEQLARSSMIPRADLETARANAATVAADIRGAQAAVAACEAAVRSAEADMEHTIIRSPVDGIVIQRVVNVGQTVVASAQAPVLYRVAIDLRTLQLWVDVDESDVDGVAVGQPVSFSVETYGSEMFHGTVSQVRPQPVQLATTTTTPSNRHAASAPTLTSYTVVVDVPNSDERLRPGMIAIASILGTRHDNARRIPTAALGFRPPAAAANLIDDGGLAFDEGDTTANVREVWKFARGRLTPIAVKTGIRGNEWTEVLGQALQDGDEVATGVTTRRTSTLRQVSTWIP